MSDKQQGTYEHTQLHMALRYGALPLHSNIKPHKHDKRHHPYRQHFRTHSVHIDRNENNQNEVHASTGQVRIENLQKLRKGLANHKIH